MFVQCSPMSNNLSHPHYELLVEGEERESDQGSDGQRAVLYLVQSEDFEIKPDYGDLLVSSGRVVHLE